MKNIIQNCSSINRTLSRTIASRAAAVPPRSSSWVALIAALLVLLLGVPRTTEAAPVGVHDYSLASAWTTAGGAANVGLIASDGITPFEVPASPTPASAAGLLVVTISGELNADPSGVTWGGASMTKATSIQTGQAYSSIYYLAYPPSGTGPLALTGFNGTRFCAYAVYATNANVIPEASATGANSSGLSIVDTVTPPSITPSVGALVVTAYGASPTIAAADIVRSKIVKFSDNSEPTQTTPPRAANIGSAGASSHMITIDASALKGRTTNTVTSGTRAITIAAFGIAPPPVFDHLAVTTVASTNAGEVFLITITGQDSGNVTVNNSSAIVSVSSSSSFMEFDWNGDGIYGDTSGTLVAGVKTIKGRNKRAETFTIAAAGGGGITTSPPSVTIDPAAFTKLQILAPGENPAPVTATGKTGTPTVRTIQVPFNVTVNAVDQFWNVVTTVSDTVGITTTDGGATLPADAPLSGGTGLYSVTFGNAGTFTVTATNVTDGTKTSSTTPALTVLGVTMRWVGDGVANLWNTTSSNWLNPLDELVAFTNFNCRALFEDTGSITPVVDIVGTILPNTITVNNSLGIDYTLGSTTGGSIGGTTTLTKSGTGTLTLTTTNTHTGTTLISGGTLVLSNSLAVQNSPVEFTGGNFNALLLPNGMTNLIVGGLIRSFGEQAISNWIINYSNLTTVTLNVDASKTISYPDIIQNTTNLGTPGLTLVKTGPGWQGLVAANQYTGPTEIRNGTLAINASFGGRLSGATVVILGSGADSGILQMGGPNGAQPGTTVGGLTTSGTGTGNAVVGGAAGISSFGMTSTNNWTYNGTFGGAGVNQNNLNVTKGGSGTLTLLKPSTHVGTTTVSGGTLLVNNTTGSGTGSGTVLVSSGGTLGGSGTISGAVTVNAGGTLSPGTSVGSLTLGVAPTLNGTVFMELNTSQSPSNDVLNVTSGTITAGGSLVVTNLPGSTLALGNSFKLFSAAVSGNFTSIVYPTPPVGTAWTNLLALNGSIALVSAVPPPTNITYSVSGGNLILNWPAGLGWQLQAQTNTLAVGLTASWVTVPGAVPPFTNAVVPANGSVFYRLVYP